MDREEILREAEKCVNGDRDQQYGSPEESFSKIAAYWTIYLGREVKASDVAQMLILFKLARLSHDETKDDTWIDIAGYAACGGEIATMRRL